MDVFRFRPLFSQCEVVSDKYEWGECGWLQPQYPLRLTDPQRQPLIKTKITNDDWVGWFLPDNIFYILSWDLNLRPHDRWASSFVFAWNLNHPMNSLLELELLLYVHTSKFGAMALKHIMWDLNNLHNFGTCMRRYQSF